MSYRVPEGFGGLAGEGAAAEIRDRARDQDGHLDTVILKILIDSEESGLGKVLVSMMSAPASR